MFFSWLNEILQTKDKIISCLALIPFLSKQCEEEQFKEKEKIQSVYSWIKSTFCGTIYHHSVQWYLTEHIQNHD